MGSHAFNDDFGLGLVGLSGGEGGLPGGLDWSTVGLEALGGAGVDGATADLPAGMEGWS